MKFKLNDLVRYTNSSGVRYFRIIRVFPDFRNKGLRGYSIAVADPDHYKLGERLASVKEESLSFYVEEPVLPIPTSMTPTTLPKFSAQAFWSDDISKLDKIQDADYIIARVFDAGTFDDMQTAVQFYGKTRVEEALTEATDLQNGTINHVAIWLNKKPEDFRAYRRARVNPMPYKTF